MGSFVPLWFLARKEFSMGEKVWTKAGVEAHSEALKIFVWTEQGEHRYTKVLKDPGTPYGFKAGSVVKHIQLVQLAIAAEKTKEDMQVWLLTQKKPFIQYKNFKPYGVPGS